MASDAPACGDEKSAYPSKSDVGRSGIGLLDAGAAAEAVSYTHLTLPTILRV